MAAVRSKLRMGDWHVEVDSRSGSRHGQKVSALGAFWPDPRYEQFFRELVRAELALAKPLLGAMLRYLGHGPGSAGLNNTSKLSEKAALQPL